MDDDQLDPATRRVRREYAEWIAFLRPATFIGLTVEEARSRVEASGGVFEPVQPGQPVTLDFRPNRVRAEVDKGTVTDASVG